MSGSAVNDTSREVGAALGVAVVGSLLSSIYGSRFLDNIPANVPASARDAADSSLGAALGVSAQLGRAGAGIADAAREAFVYAMSRASLVTAVIAVVGAFVAWRFLPARATDEADAQAVDVIDVVERRPCVSRCVSGVRQPRSCRCRSGPTGQLSPVPPRPQ